MALSSAPYVGGDSDAFPALEPEFVRNFLGNIDFLEGEFSNFFDLLVEIHEGRQSADLLEDAKNNLERLRSKFCDEVVYPACGHYDRSPFSAFVRFCFHEINNLIAPLVMIANEGDDLGSQFSEIFPAYRVHVQHYFELLRHGQPPAERVNLESALQTMAQEHRVNFHVMPSCDPDTKVRISLETLSSVLDNLQRGANQADSGNATVHLVLDSDVDGEWRPRVYLHFLSNVPETALTPERFKELLTRRPAKGQSGGLGLHLSELLLQAQQKDTNVFSDGIPKANRTPACLQFRQENSSVPLTDHDRFMVQGLNLPTNFLFTIDLSGMRVRSVKEHFDRAFYESVAAVFPSEPNDGRNDPLLGHLIERARDGFFDIVSCNGDLASLLDEIPEEDEDLRLSFSRLVLALRQRLGDRVSP